MVKIYYVMDEKYFIDKENKILFLSLNNGKTKESLSFKEADEYVKKYKNVNRIHKPFWLLFYTDWKNGRTSDWEYKEVDSKEVFKYMR